MIEEKTVDDFDIGDQVSYEYTVPVFPCFPVDKVFSGCGVVTDKRDSDYLGKCLVVNNKIHLRPSECTCFKKARKKRGSSSTVRAADS